MIVGVVLPTFNCSRLLRRAIDSVLAQTRAVDDFVVVDDGSSDDTRSVVAAYGSTVRYIYQTNRGCAAARNRGIRESKGDWIALIDHDDEWLPSKIEKQVAALTSKPDAVVCYTAICAVSGETEIRYAPYQPDELWPALRLENGLLPSCMMFKKDVLEAVGGFDERLRASCEDWDLNVRLLARYPHGFALVDEHLTKYYLHPGNASSNYRTMLENNLSIVENTLLTGLAGIRRTFWRQRIRSHLYYQAAIGARGASNAGLSYLFRSFLEWPSPTFDPKRFKTLGAELIDRSSLRNRTRCRP